MKHLNIAVAALLAAGAAHAGVACDTVSEDGVPLSLAPFPAAMQVPPAFLTRLHLSVVQPANNCVTPVRKPGRLSSPATVALGTPVTHPKVAAPPWVGDTDATVQSQFPAVFLYNVQQNPTLDATMSLWNVYNWGIMSAEYVRNGGNVPALMEVFAQKLSAANLVLAAQAFGITNMSPYVQAYTPVSIKATFNSRAAAAAVPMRMSHAMAVEHGLSNFLQPAWKMTQTDLFYEAFAIKGATVESALVAVGISDAIAVKSAWDFGYWVGGNIVIVLDKVDPNINIELGNVIGTLVTDVIDTVVSTSGQGYVEDPDGGYDDGYGNWYPDIDPDFYWYIWIGEY